METYTNETTIISSFQENVIGMHQNRGDTIHETELERLHDSMLGMKSPIEAYQDPWRNDIRPLLLSENDFSIQYEKLEKIGSELNVHLQPEPEPEHEIRCSPAVYKTEQQPSENRLNICSACDQQVRGRCITAMLRKFHPEHFVCSFCLKQLVNGTFIERGEKPFCSPCHIRLFG